MQDRDYFLHSHSNEHVTYEEEKKKACYVLFFFSVVYKATYQAQKNELKKRGRLWSCPDTLTFRTIFHQKAFSCRIVMTLSQACSACKQRPMVVISSGSDCRLEGTQRGWQIVIDRDRVFYMQWKCFPDYIVMRCNTCASETQKNPSNGPLKM